MKKVALVLCIVLSGALVHAASQTCLKEFHLKDFTFYSVGDATVQNSDFQGLTGTGQDFISLSDFAVNSSDQRDCLTLSSAGDTILNKSSVNGSVESPWLICISETGVNGSLSAQSVELNDAGISGLIYSKNIPKYNGSLNRKKYVKTETVMRVKHDLIQNEIKKLESDLNSFKSIPVDCLSLSRNDFDQNPNVEISALALSGCRSIVLRASATTRITIRVTGEQAILKAQYIKMQGGLTPQNIVWNMSPLKSLFISNTATAFPGMPGQIFAPQANVEFYNALITGSMVVKNLLYKSFDSKVDSRDGGENHTGQINKPVSSGRQPYE